MRRTVRSTAARVLVSLVLLAPVVPAEPVAAVTCTDVHVVWARGANLGIDGFDWTQFVDTDLRQRIGPDVTMSDYQLGDPGFGGFSYQSVDDIALIVEGLAGFVPGGPYDGLTRGAATLILVCHNARRA